MTELDNTKIQPDFHEVSNPDALIEHPVVSVLMLAYNHEPYLAQAIEGVLLQQTDVPIELLIGEDCSTDNTREIALRYQREHPGTIRLFTTNRNIGASLNYRRIFVAARGEFIAYLDGDDYWLPGKLARQIKYLRENPLCSAVYTNALTVDQYGRQNGLFNDVGNEQFDLGALLRHGNFLNNSSGVCRATSRSVVLGIDMPSIDFRGHLTLARTGFLAQIADPLTVYRMGAVGSMVAQSNDRVRQLYWEAILSVPRELVSDDDLSHGIADFMRRVIFRAVRTRRIGLLQEWAPRVFAASPYGRLRTSTLVAASVIRIACKEMLGRVSRGWGGHRAKVLYRR